MRNDDFKVNCVTNDSVLLLVGMPKVGAELSVEGDPDIVTMEDIKILTDVFHASEIVPVGSHGIAYECQLLAENNGMTLSLKNNDLVNLYKSAGPVTCVIAAVSLSSFQSVPVDIPRIKVIGGMTKL